MRVAPHLPPWPPSSPTLRERKGGDCAPHLPPSAPTKAGEEGGRLCYSPSLPAPLSLPQEERKGGMSGAGAILCLSPIPRLHTPLPQCGRGAGGEGAPQCGWPLTFPPGPRPLPRYGRGRGGRAERGRSCACHRYRVYTPLSRSAGGPSPSLPDPLSLPQEERKGG